MFGKNGRGTLAVSFLDFQHHFQAVVPLIGK